MWGEPYLVPAACGGRQLHFEAPLIHWKLVPRGGLQPESEGEGEDRRETLKPEGVVEIFFDQ